MYLIERVNETDPVEPIVCQSWSSRASKMTQPHLDFMGELAKLFNKSLLLKSFTKAFKHVSSRMSRKFFLDTTEIHSSRGANAIFATFLFNCNNSIFI